MACYKIFLDLLIMLWMFCCCWTQAIFLLILVNDSIPFPVFVIFSLRGSSYCVEALKCLQTIICTFLYSIAFRFGVTFCLLFLASGGFLFEQARFINDELPCRILFLWRWYWPPFYLKERLTIKIIVWQLQLKKYRGFFVHLLVGLLFMPGYWPSSFFLRFYGLRRYFKLILVGFS